MKKWFKSGTPWIWLNAGAIAVCILMVASIILLIASRGMVYFWPKDVMVADYNEPTQKKVLVVGELQNSKTVPAIVIKEGNENIPVPKDKLEFERYLIKESILKGDKYKIVFRTYLKDFLKSIQYPKNIVVVEQRSGGNFYGYFHAIKQKDSVIDKENIAGSLDKLLDRATELHDQIYEIEKDDIGTINYKKSNLNLEKIKLDFYKEKDIRKYQSLKISEAKLDAENDKLKTKLLSLRQKINRDILVFKTQDNKTFEINLANIIRIYQPNQLSVFGKSILYVEKFWEFLSDDPREANTEGGIFPAILGTVVMVILMTILVTPIGVIGAIYLREYAKQGVLIRIVRISVNNLAGVPSIVFGVFGLGFFVYVLGGSLDVFFYPERVDSNITTFGSPSLMWAALTLALLTLPVVIVATEEGLSRVPRAIREGSLALGATKAETLWRTVLPMASPGMITGLILAIARAAGEVAPLMLVGVVMYSPSPPIDLNPPFLHVDRTFMHLGNHIYGLAFQSPDSEAVQPLVFATAFILVMVIIILNLTAISIRNRLREKYRALEN